jgi:UDP-glucose 4-epimerase
MSPIIFGDGRQSRDFTYVTEIARGIAAAAGVEGAIGSTINVAFGRGTSILALARTIADVCGRADCAPKFDPPRPGDVRALCAETTRCRTLLGFKPSIGLAEGLASYVAWLRAGSHDTASLVDPQAVNWKT